MRRSLQPCNSCGKNTAGYLWSASCQAAGSRRFTRPSSNWQGTRPQALTAADITAGAGKDAACRAALSMFCAVFGAVAGDLALAHGARGGVYISGGIAQKIEAFLAQSAFRQRFEDKGRLSPFVQAIPTRLIVNPDVAMLGAARAGARLASLSS